MEPRETIKKLEEHPEFKEWRKKNKDSFLAHIFRMYDEANKDIVQAGYYNKDGSITTFFIEKGNIRMATEKEIFKRPEDKILKLDIRKVKLNDEEAMKKAEKMLKETYKMDSLKNFMILQNLPALGQVYNITFVTRAFSTLNVKVGAGNGGIVKHELTSLMDYRRG